MDPLLFSDDEIVEVDPVTKEYPFLTAAAAGVGDKATAYILLTKNLSFLERYREQVVEERTLDDTNTNPDIMSQSKRCSESNLKKCE